MIHRGGVGGAPGGSGGSGSVPGATQDERDILDALTTDDTRIGEASGGDLVDLAGSIGFARGYAMCRCALSPSGPPEDPVELTECAEEETGSLVIARRPDSARCITERMGEVAGFEDHLRCLTRSLRDDGVEWTAVCEDAERPGPSAPCSPPDGADMLFFECLETIYCSDDQPVLGHRCDGLAACSDLTDERSCYELTGRDQLSCGGEVWFPQQFCRDSDCGSGLTPPLCDPARPDRFLCAGGSDVESSLVCDRNPDCADGSDEAHCLR